MGGGRTPCCDKAGVKKGPWTQAEDLRLISFIQKHGHGNWRALPKQAGLLRCGKSCRLRWINYLHPDIKRGNFTQEEEETIIKLHELFGNKWSKIASQLPGRTDNEIKNVWNTYLKKRLLARGSNNRCIKPKESLISSSPSSSSVSNGLQGMGYGSVSDRPVGSFEWMLTENKQRSQPGDVSNQTSPTAETIELSNSPSSSYNSHITHMNQTNWCKPEKEEASLSLYSSEKECAIDAVVDNVNKQDWSEEVIEIPFEPNLDFWDMLNGDSTTDSEVPVCDVEDENKREVESWWWLAYLENELGLEATIDETQQSPTTKNLVEPPVPTSSSKELMSMAEIDPVAAYFHIRPPSP